MTEKKRRKTPTARYMAADRLLAALEGPLFQTADVLSTLFDTKVSDKKREDYIQQVQKFIVKLRERLLKVKRNFGPSV